jgi:hypothetical protein
VGEFVTNITKRGEARNMETFDGGVRAFVVAPAAAAEMLATTITEGRSKQARRGGGPHGRGPATKVRR